MPWLEPVTLRGAHARLEPLSQDHCDGLTEAVKDGELWKLWYTSVPTAEGMGKEIDRRLGLQAAGSMLPLTVFDAERQNRGHDDLHERRYAEPPGRDRLDLVRQACAAQRVNTQCKLLLLTHAFEKLDCIAVEFRTHFFNHQSRRGIERLGAKQDGILRSHSIAPNGTLRDTVVYSIIASEWPTVKAHLNYQLNEKAR